MGSNWNHWFFIQEGEIVGLGMKSFAPNQPRIAWAAVAQNAACVASSSGPARVVHRCRDGTQFESRVFCPSESGRSKTKFRFVFQVMRAFAEVKVDDDEGDDGGDRDDDDGDDGVVGDDDGDADDGDVAKNSRNR